MFSYSIPLSFRLVWWLIYVELLCAFLSVPRHCCVTLVVWRNGTTDNSETLRNLSLSRCLSRTITKQRLGTALNAPELLLLLFLITEWSIQFRKSLRRFGSQCEGCLHFLRKSLNVYLLLFNFDIFLIGQLTLAKYFKFYLGCYSTVMACQISESFQE